MSGLFRAEDEGGRSDFAFWFLISAENDDEYVELLSDFQCL